jgi:hypothetical protein
MKTRFAAEDIPYDIEFERLINDCLDIILVLYKTDKNNNVSEIKKFSKIESEGFSNIELIDDKTIRVWLNNELTKDLVNVKIHADGYIIDENPEAQDGKQHTYFIDNVGFIIKPTLSKQYL